MAFVIALFLVLRCAGVEDPVVVNILNKITLRLVSLIDCDGKADMAGL